MRRVNTMKIPLLGHCVYMFAQLPKNCPCPSTLLRNRCNICSFWQGNRICGYTNNSPVWEHGESTIGIFKPCTLLPCHPLALFPAPVHQNRCHLRKAPRTVHPRCSEEGSNPRSACFQYTLSVLWRDARRWQWMDACLNGSMPQLSVPMGHMTCLFIPGHREAAILLWKAAVVEFAEFGIYSRVMRNDKSAADKRSAAGSRRWGVDLWLPWSIAK